MHPEIQKDRELLPYEIRKGAHDDVEVKMGDKWLKPAEISAMVLQKLKTDAEDRLGVKITEAIITVPAYFDDSQRKATKDAGEIAGLSVKRVINEPTAAALAYGLNKKKDEKIAVYDFGGGTFDISVLEIGDDTIEVRGTGGDTHLGGDDVDQLIIRYLVDEFKKEQGVDISKDQLAVQRLKDAAEKAKHELWFFILVHPFIFIKLCLWRAVRFFSLIRPMGFWFYQSGLKQMLFVASSLLAIAALFISGFSGMLLSLKEKKSVFYYLIFFALTTPFILIMTVVQSRYRFQIYPFLAIFGGYLIYKYIWERDRAVKNSLWIAGGFLALLTSVDIVFSFTTVAERIFKFI